MRSHVTSAAQRLRMEAHSGFNTASGMRSHVTSSTATHAASAARFQYRKRYEITCDYAPPSPFLTFSMFQYRKRYEITCDPNHYWILIFKGHEFQYRKRYEITCDAGRCGTGTFLRVVSIPQAV